MSSGPRSTPRTRRILEAAIAIIAERGLRGLTHRAVDAQAGLPEGSTSGYYRTRLALLTGTAEFLRDQLLGGVEHAVGQIGSAPSDDLVIDAVVELLDGWLAEPAIIVVVAELKLEGLRTPEIDEAFAAWREELIDFVAQTTARIGSDDPRLKATAVIAALEGVLLSAVAVPPESRRDYLNPVVSSILGAMLAHSGESERARS